jgi:hypothetical protein
MTPRTIFILITMFIVVIVTSAFGAYRDHDDDKDDGVVHHNTHHQKKNSHVSSTIASSTDTSDLVGAAGAGMSHKVSSVHLDTSGKANGPYVNDGPNTYRGKVGGYNIHNDDDDTGSESESDSDSDSEDGIHKKQDSDTDDSDFMKKLKYIQKSISKLFKEIFSKWGSQGSIMAPSGIEELNPSELHGEPSIDGFNVREKFKKQAKQGMRKLKNAFRGRK